MRVALNHYVRKFGKILLWLIGIILVLAGLIFLLIQAPFVHQYAKKRVVNFLQDKLKTEVEIGRLSLNLPNRLVLEGVYFEDQKGDTLLAGDTLRVDMNFWKLLSNQVVLREIDLRGITAYVDRPASDSTYNFEYIIKAFIREDEKDTPPPDSTAALRFSVSKINLDRIRLHLKDEMTGKDAFVYFRHFDTEITDFDRDYKKFRIPKITLSGLTARMSQTKSLSRKSITTDTLNMPSPFQYPDLELREIDLSDINIEYQNSVTAIDSKLDLGTLLLKIDSLDLQNQKADIQSFDLENTSGYFALDETAQKAVEATATEIKTVVEKGWTIHLARLGIDDVDFKYDDLTEKKLSRGIDYNHIDVKDIRAKATGLFYDRETFSGNVEQLSLTEHSGLDLKTFHADFHYGNDKSSLDNLLIETDRTLIKDQIRLTYPSLDTIKKAPGIIGIDARFIENRIAVSDILLFAPSLSSREIFRNNPDAVIHVDGDVTGYVRDINISDLELSGLGDTYLQASGNIKGLPDFQRSIYNLRITRLYTTSNDIYGLIPRSSIPTQIQLPEYTELKGVFKGTFTAFTTNMHINSGFGSGDVNGTFKNLANKSRASYDGTVSAQQFDIGRLLRREDEIGKISLTAKMKGSGMDPKTATMQIEANVASAEYKGYNYQDLSFKGTADNGVIDVLAKMSDPNITFDLEGRADMSGQYPKANFILNADSINFQKINLYDKDLRFRGSVIADLKTADPDHLNGTIGLSNSIISLSGKRYRLDTVSIVSVATDSGDTIDVKSEFLTLHAEGNYNLTQLPPAFMDVVGNYINLRPGTDTTYTYAPQQITFDAQFIRSPLVEELFPELTDMEDARLTGNFDSNIGEIKVEGSLPRMLYKEFIIDGIELDIQTENNALNYALTFDQLSSKKIQVLNTSLSGKAQNDVLDITLKVQDAEEKERYRIAGELTSSPDQFDLHILPEGLLLDYKPWNVSPDNHFHFSEGGMMVSNFRISNGNQSMSVNSSPQQLSAPLEIEFNDFKIETLTRMVTKDSLLAGGVVNGTALIKDLKTNMVFSSDLTVKDFSFQGDTVGNIALHVNNEKPDTYSAKATITGYGNEVDLEGFYYTSGDKSNYDLDVDIGTLQIKSIEGFTNGEIDKGTGSMSGRIKITGSSLSPQIRGDIRFSEAGFNITRFNSYYRISDEGMSFTPEGVVLNNFTLIDSAGNEAIVDGIVYTNDYKDYRFGLNVRADNFQVLNSTRDNNKLYYGKLFVDTRMHIGGGFDNPVIDGTVRVKENTNLTVVVPQSDPGIVEREGIVEFVDMDTLEITFLAATIDSLNRSELTGMDLTVNIIIDRDAQLNLIIDEANGDYLRVRGTAELLGGIDPSGKISLTGRYELDEGAYSFSFNQLKREFLIDKGSSITWTGEPMTANVDVTAVYIAKTAPLSLVQNQLADAEQSVVNTYKQKLPFRILLTMKGELLKPDIAFDIQLPEKNYGVSGEIVTTVNSRLAELRTIPSELNKQVFAVLLLNRFISEDPFQNSARGGGISSLARQSASKLLSEQLNSIAGGMIAGFDLNFDINSIEDYTSGELQNRTDLTVGLSKRLLDDRLNITVGSQFELEGPKDSDRKSTNIAGDVSVEYQLSKDGRYLVRAYRKNEFIVLQGQVVETGLGFVFTVDYEKFKDIFAKKTEEYKAARKEERQARKEEMTEDEEE